ARVTKDSSISLRAVRSPVRRGVRSRSSGSKSAEMTSLPPGSRSGPHERQPSVQPCAASDDRQRDAGVCPHARRAATVAVDGDNECLSRRRLIGDLAGSRGEPRLFSPQRRTAPLPLLHRAHAPMTSALATLHPAYFALVMATGIVSIACSLLGL